MDGVTIHQAIASLLLRLSEPHGGNLPVNSLLYAYFMGLREICEKSSKDPRAIAAAFLEGTADLTQPKETLT